MKIFAYTQLHGFYSRPTGVAKHAAQMFHGLARSPGCNLTVLTTQDQLDDQGNMASDHPLADLPVAAIRRNRWPMERVWDFVSWPSVDAFTPDADWIYAPYERAIPTKKALAVTIHALYYWDAEMPGQSPLLRWRGRIAAARRFARVASRSDLVLTVSEFLKKQIIHRYHLEEKKVIIVGNGVEQFYFDAGAAPQARIGADGTKPYVVCMSGLSDLDGAPYVLDTARALAALDSNIEILVAGHQHQKKYLQQAADHKNLRLLGYVPAEKLAGLLHGAVALLFLNRYETFGLGAAEGMAAGTPVIGTNFTAVPEVVGDAGWTADTRRPQDIAQFIVDLSRSPDLRANYIARGRRRAAMFTWDACVSRLLDALKTA